MGGPQGPVARRCPALPRRAVLTGTLERPDRRQKCVCRVFIFVHDVQSTDSAAAARVVMNEIASCRGLGDTPAPECGPRSAFNLGWPQLSAARSRSDTE